MSPTNPIPASQVKDFDGMSQVMKTLLKGESAGDVAKLKAAFHPDERMFGQAGLAAMAWRRRRNRLAA